MLATSTWREHSPGLDGISDLVSKVLDAKAHRSVFGKGSRIFGPSSPAENLLLLVSGTVRDQQLSETGCEIVLYRVHSGESCVLTTACLLAYENYSAEGIAETDLEAILIPRDDFDELMSMLREFRTLVFEAYSKRITDLFLVIEEIAFKRMDIRLAQKLIELKDAHAALHLTHHQLAIELGSAQEVISRQLKEFERRDWVALRRGVIVLRDLPAIQNLAETN